MRYNFALGWRDMRVSRNDIDDRAHFLYIYEVYEETLEGTAPASRVDS
ncbi:MAG: hypothetical protein FWE20_11605 [Defluviitaleaceae bacterium]|nr:hypothetical protein [Defluviitaleaceae bacterium]